MLNNALFQESKNNSQPEITLEYLNKTLRNMNSNPKLNYTNLIIQYFELMTEVFDDTCPPDFGKLDFEGLTLNLNYIERVLFSLSETKLGKKLNNLIRFRRTKIKEIFNTSSNIEQNLQNNVRSSKDKELLKLLIHSSKIIIKYTKGKYNNLSSNIKRKINSLSEKRSRRYNNYQNSFINSEVTNQLIFNELPHNINVFLVEGCSSEDKQFVYVYLKGLYKNLYGENIEHPETRPLEPPESALTKIKITDNEIPFITGRLTLKETYEMNVMYRYYLEYILDERRKYLELYSNLTDESKLKFEVLCFLFYYQYKDEIKQELNEDTKFILETTFNTTLKVFYENKSELTLPNLERILGTGIYTFSHNWLILKFIALKLVGQTYTGNIPNIQNIELDLTNFSDINAIISYLGINVVDIIRNKGLDPTNLNKQNKLKYRYEEDIKSSFQYFTEMITCFMCYLFNEKTVPTSELLSVLDTDLLTQTPLILESLNKYMKNMFFYIKNDKIEKLHIDLPQPNKGQTEQPNNINESEQLNQPINSDLFSLLDNKISEKLTEDDYYNKSRLGYIAFWGENTNFEIKQKYLKYNRYTANGIYDNYWNWNLYDNYYLILNYINTYKIFCLCYIGTKYAKYYAPKINIKKYKITENYKYLGQILIKFKKNGSIPNKIKKLYIYKNDKYIINRIYNYFTKYLLYDNELNDIPYGTIRNKFTVTEREFHICSIVCGLYYYHFICNGLYINFFSYFSPEEIAHFYNNIGIGITASVNEITFKLTETVSIQTKVLTLTYGDIISNYVLIGDPRRYSETYNKFRHTTDVGQGFSEEYIKHLQNNLDKKLDELFRQKIKEQIKLKAREKIIENLKNSGEKIKEILDLIGTSPESTISNFSNNPLFKNKNIEQFKKKPSSIGKLDEYPEWITQRDNLIKPKILRNLHKFKKKNNPISFAKESSGGSKKYKIKIKFNEITKKNNKLYDIKRKYYKYFYNNIYIYNQYLFLYYYYNLNKKNINDRFITSIWWKVVSLFSKIRYSINIFFKTVNIINTKNIIKNTNIIDIIIKEYNLKIGKNILELNTNNIFFLKKYINNKNKNLYLLQLVTYFYTKIININNYNYKNINIKSYRNYIQKDYIKQYFNKKMHLIITNISNFNDELYSLFQEYQNIQLIFNNLFMFLMNLNKNGIIIYYIQYNILKSTGDILLLFKQYFKKVYLYYNYESLYKLSGTYLILDGFLGISQNEINKLFKIFNKLYKNDSTSMNFNIKDNDIREKKIKNPNKIERYINISNYLIIKKKKTKKSVYKYPSQLLDLSLESKEYNFIKEYVDKQILFKSICNYKLIEIFKKLYYKNKNKNKNVKFNKKKIINILKNKIYKGPKSFLINKYNFNIYNNKYLKIKISKSIKENQFVNSYLYAIKYDLELIDLKKNKFFYKFYKNIEQLIVNNIYLYDKPIIYKFDDKIKFEMIIEDINEYLQNRYKEFTVMVRFIKELEWTQRNMKFYSDTYSNKYLIKSIKKKYNIKSKITDYWITLYEIIERCKLINSVKYYNYLYIGKSNEKDNINVIETYIKNETQIYKYNIFNSKTIKKENNKINLCIIDDTKRINKDKLNNILLQLSKTSKLVLRIQLPLVDMNIVELIQILYNNFDNIYLYKSVISNITDLKSFEMYIICTKFGKNKKEYKKFSENFITGICKILNNMLFEFEKQRYYILNEKYIPKKLLNKVLILRDKYLKNKNH